MRRPSWGERCGINEGRVGNVTRAWDSQTPPSRREEARKTWHNRRPQLSGCACVSPRYTLLQGPNSRPLVAVSDTKPNRHGCRLLGPPLDQVRHLTSAGTSGQPDCVTGEQTQICGPDKSDFFRFQETELTRQPAGLCPTCQSSLTTCTASGTSTALRHRSRPDVNQLLRLWLDQARARPRFSQPRRTRMKIQEPTGIAGSN